MTLPTEEYIHQLQQWATLLHGKLAYGWTQTRTAPGNNFSSSKTIQTGWYIELFDISTEFGVGCEIHVFSQKEFIDAYNIIRDSLKRLLTSRYEETVAKSNQLQGLITDLK